MKEHLWTSHNHHICSRRYPHTKNSAIQIFHLFSLCWLVLSTYLPKGKHTTRYLQRGVRPWMHKEEAIWASSQATRAVLASIVCSEGRRTWGQRDKHLQRTARPLSVPPGINLDLWLHAELLFVLKSAQEKAHEVGELHFSLFIMNRFVPKVPLRRDRHHQP